MAVTLVVEGAEARQFVYRASQLAELAAYLHALTHPEHHRGSRDLISSALIELPPSLLSRIRLWSPMWGVQRARFLFPLDLSSDVSFDQELQGVVDYPPDLFLETSAKCIIETLRDYSAQFPETRERLRNDLLTHTKRLSRERSEIATRILDDPDGCRKEIADILADAGTQPHFRRQWSAIKPRLAGEVMLRQRELQIRGGISIADTSDTARTYNDPTRVVFDKLYHAFASVKEESVVGVPSIWSAPHFVVKHVSGMPIVVQYPLHQAGPISFDLIAHRLEALNDPMRVKICYHILREPRATIDLAAQLNTSEAQISRNLRKLREAGLVIGERDGRVVRYRMNTDAVRRLGADFMDTLLH
ncbi:DUF5937 family protein [Rhodococcus sp. IEGM1428]|uniref:ArsR/SmtB family transcription factor n=1 Tax=Rhodococcus sp. IEGM1428 TaxID=3392191 RepID=UPI003D0C8965